MIKVTQSILNNSWASSPAVICPQKTCGKEFFVNSWCPKTCSKCGTELPNMVDMIGHAVSEEYRKFAIMDYHFGNYI